MKRENRKEIKSHSKPRPLPFGCAPQGWYAGSGNSDLESHLFYNNEIPDQVRDDNKWWIDGFTLIELLVVVLIIGILAAVLAVCKRRKIPCACVYIVSDYLGGKTWQPDFKNPQIGQNLRRLLALCQHVPA